MRAGVFTAMARINYYGFELKSGAFYSINGK
jgi:hypothetical protein